MVIEKIKRRFMRLYKQQKIKNPKQQTYTNIEKFDEFVAKTLGLLYTAFPVPRELNACKDYGLQYVYEKSIRHVMLTDEEDFEAKIFYSTVQWLHQSGYIIIGREKKFPLGFEEVVLTTKGLVVLKAVPASLRDDRTIGTRLIDAVKSGSKEVIEEVVKLVLSQAVIKNLLD